MLKIVDKMLTSGGYLVELRTKGWIFLGQIRRSLYGAKMSAARTLQQRKGLIRRARPT